MVSSRTLSTKRPVFPYGSKGYSILYYGVSRKGEFKTSEIKNCLEGLFPNKVRNTDFLEPANRLTKAGLIHRVNLDTWIVTREGVREMVLAAAYHGEFRIRTTSIRYIDDTKARIRKIHDSNMSLMEKLDAEDIILEEIEEAMKKRARMKSQKKSS